MPFDPSYPPPNADIESAPLRAQFNGLKALIDAISSITAAQVDSTDTLPPGSPANASVSVVGSTLHFSFALPQGQEGVAGPEGAVGPAGPVGPPFAQAVVDAVTTLDPGQPAAVGVSFDGTNVRFTFSLPRGSDGSQGPAGNDGSPGAPGQDGAAGPPGPAGPPFAQAVVDGVTTLDPGQPATVGAWFDGSNVRFSFGIPRGSDGTNGGDGPPGPPFAQAVVDAVNTLLPWEPATVATSFDGSYVRFTFGLPRGYDGPNGPPGQDGAPGPPGEVTQAQLDTAISGTSANTNAVSTLGLTVSDPPTQAEMQQIATKLDELINALRR